jgi:hypothetical protein
MKHTKKWITGYIVAWVSLAWTFVEIAISDLTVTLYTLTAVIASVLFLVSLDEGVS